MKLRDILNEGTWSIPNTAKKAMELVNALKRPLTPEEARRTLYPLVGDDDVFDLIDEIENKSGPEADVSPAVRRFLRSWMKETMMFSKERWDPEAVKIVRKFFGLGGR